MMLALVVLGVSGLVAWFYVGTVLLAHLNDTIHRAADDRRILLLSLITIVTLPAAIVEGILLLIERRRS